MRLPFFLRLIPLACCFAIIAGAAPLPNKAKATNSAFNAIVVGTIQYAHDDVWIHTPASSGPLVPIAREVVRGQKLDIVVCFGEFAVNAQDEADVVYDLVITMPDGTEQVAGASLTGIKGRVNTRRMVYTAAQTVGFSAPAGSPAGVYRYTAKLNDRIGLANVAVSGEVTVVDGAVRPLPADFNLAALESWLTHYYEHPDPRSALPVLLFAARDPQLGGNAGAWPPILGSFEMILRDNPWLVNVFKTQVMSAETGAAERNVMLLALAFAFRTDSAFGSFLPPEPRETFSQLQQQTWEDPDRELLSGGQLDTLWGRFFATGAYAPVQRLAGALAYEKFHGSVDAFKLIKPQPKEVPPDVMKEIVHRSAVWSLKSNAPRHPLLNSYLAFLANDPKTPPAVALQIALIIGAKVQTRDGKVFDPMEQVPAAKP